MHLFLQNLPHIFKKVRPYRLDKRKFQLLLLNISFLPLSYYFWKYGLTYF